VIRDVLTVAWKEWRELMSLSGGARGGRLSLVILLAVFGVLLPLQSGADWVRSATTVFYWAWVPLMLVGNAIADAIAGERERHTLETLLASRLPDPAILLGKVLAAVSYGWGLVMGMLLLSLVTVNMSARSDGLLLFPARIAVGAPLLALLGAGLAAAAGVLVSLRAATVRHAAQALSVGILLLIFVPVFLAESMPDAWKARAASWLMTAGADRIAWSAAAGLAGLDLALMGLALARFRRVRLIVD